MLFQFGLYKLDIDVERTRKFYNSPYSLPTSQQCTCDGCRNFDKAILLASDKVLHFLNSMGIDPRRASEAYGVTGHCNTQNEYWYGGWYHAVGTILESPINESEHPITENEYNTYIPDADSDFKVWFISTRNAMGWIDPNFPSPNVEIEFSVRLPWVI